MCAVDLCFFVVCSVEMWGFFWIFLENVITLC